MAEELSPHQVRARQFGVARKGYDRAEVDAYLGELADELHRLQRSLDDATERGLAIGIDDTEALALELQSIGGEVGSILEAARATAEGIRSRASTDADEWRSTAETDSGLLVTEATEQAQSMRAAAWNEGSSLLASAVAEAEAHVAEAKEAVLVIRAEAEREAIRQTGDAKRDRDEMVGGARAEAEQIIESARNESDGILEAASQQAELAQERARALEDRRTELLSELEQARASIGELETEIESKRQALETPPEPEPVPDERTHHTSDGGSVRIVSPGRVVQLEPVDTEELVAEVEAMRSAAAEEPKLEATSDSEPEPEGTSDIGHRTTEAEQTPDSRDQKSEPEPEGISDVGHRTTESEPEETSDNGQRTTEPEPEAEPVLEDDAGGDELASLFASLKEPEETSDAGTRTPEPEAEETSGIGHRISEPEPAPEGISDDGQPTPEPEGETEPEVPSLIPVQNETLRSIKRTLVELQNETLEHLRVERTWEPEESFTDRFGSSFETLTEAAGDDSVSGSGDAFGLDLYDALSNALEGARSSGAGDRQVAAAASKVFRTWRSDEAERRVMAIGEAT